MDTFLESEKPTNLNKREFDSLNRLITNKEIEIVIKSLSAKMTSRAKGIHSKVLPEIYRSPVNPL